VIGGIQMANFEEILSANEKAFEGAGDVKGSFSTLSTKLNELGYDVLINHKEKAEFIPANRLNEVVSQRDTFKTQVQDLNKQLQAMQKGAEGNAALQTELQKLMDQNNDLLKNLESTKVNTEIMLAAKDAINAKDLLAFINFDNIKVNAKGEVLGVDSEIARLKTEKPYLFGTTDNKGGKGNRGGMDNKGGKDDNSTVGMNAMIRRAAGKVL
jgi:regulator of replication initiation timing